MPAGIADPVGQFVADIAEDLAEAVLARDWRRFAAAVADRVTRRPPRALAGRKGVPELALERRHPLGDGRLRGPGRPRRHRSSAQLVVRLLDLLKPPRRLR